MCCDCAFLLRNHLRYGVMLTWALIWWIRWHALWETGGREEGELGSRLEAQAIGPRCSWGWAERGVFTVTGPGAKYKCWQATGSQMNILTWLESLAFLLWLPCPEMWPRAQGSPNRDTVLLFNLLLLFIHSFSCLVASAFHLFLKMFLSLSPGFDPLCSLHPNLPNTQYLIQLTSCHQYGVPAAGSSNSKPNPIIWG